MDGIKRLEELAKISGERKLTTVEIIEIILANTEVCYEVIKRQQTTIDALSNDVKLLQAQVINLYNLRSFNQDQINKIDKHLGGILYE